jgi:hypothetical protein
MRNYLIGTEEEKKENKGYNNYKAFEFGYYFFFS